MRKFGMADKFIPPSGAYWNTAEAANGQSLSIGHPKDFLTNLSLDDPACEISAQNSGESFPEDPSYSRA